MGAFYIKQLCGIKSSHYDSTVITPMLKYKSDVLRMFDILRRSSTISFVWSRELGPVVDYKEAPADASKAINLIPVTGTIVLHIILILYMMSNTSAKTGGHKHLFYAAINAISL